MATRHRRSILHKAHTNNQLYSHTLLVKNKTGAPLYSFSLDSLNFINGPQKIDAIPIKQLIRRGVPRLPDLVRVASCNGLILSSHEDIKKIWAIWNPLTRECRELPNPNFELHLIGYGFGYDYDADDYRVVRIDRVFPRGKVVYRTLVYSLKSDSWRKIGDFNCDNKPWVWRDQGAFWNGSLYWLSGDSITALDLRTETYSQLPLPVITKIDLGNGSCFQLPLPPVNIRTIMDSLNLNFAFHLDALDGCLIFSSNNRNGRIFDGWETKDNGVEKSWVKLFSFEPYSQSVSWSLRLVAYLKSKRQVVLQHDWGFFWFDSENNCFKKFSIHGLPHITSSQICPGSLVRLNARGTAIGFGGVAARRTSTRKRKRKRKTNKRAYSRLKLCVRDRHEKCCSDNHFCRMEVCSNCESESETEEYFFAEESLEA